jgi:glucose/arabinose dehydrogenase
MLIVSGLGSKQLQLLRINKEGNIIGRPLSILNQLGVRFRIVRQGPDGFLYVLTEMRNAGNDDLDGALLRIEPAEVD